MWNWPEKFVYVCNASQAAVVNVLPIVHAGLERISSVKIFCGSPKADEAGARILREAIYPATHLVAQIEKLAGPARAAPPTEIVYGQADQIVDWQQRMRQICNAADGGAVLYNLTGGTKWMSLGGVLGGGNTIELIRVAGAPLRTEVVKNTSMLKAPRLGQLSIAAYLSMYGVEEIGREAKNKWKTFCIQNEPRIEAFGDCVLKLAQESQGRTQAFFSALNNGTRIVIDQRGNFNPGIVNFPDAQRSIKQRLSMALGTLAGMPGLDSVPPTANGNPACRISDELVARLLCGGWLEAYLFNSLRKLLSGRNDVEIDCGLRFGFPRGEEIGERLTAYEIDVAIMIRDQLHIVEAKTASFSGNAAKKSNEHSLAQIESAKRLLLGQFGRVFAVNPRETVGNLETGSGDFPRRAQAAGVELLLGGECMQILADKITRIVNE